MYFNRTAVFAGHERTKFFTIVIKLAAAGNTPLRIACGPGRTLSCKFLLAVGLAENFLALFLGAAELVFKKNIFSVAAVKKTAFFLCLFFADFLTE